nr:Rpn family recombination-promoting nuclease/putative transposase [Niabella aurantiaca]
MAFLNALFQGRKVIRDLEYHLQAHGGAARHYRKTIFDLTCTGAEGGTFIIELKAVPVMATVFFTPGGFRFEFLTCIKYFNFIIDLHLKILTTAKKQCFKQL